MPPQVDKPEEQGKAGQPAEDPWPDPDVPANDPGNDDATDQTPLGHDELVALRSSRHVARRPRRRKRWPWITALLVVLVGVAAYGLYVFAWPYARDLLVARNVSSAAAGYPDLVTGFSDGTATISGEIGTSADADLLIAAIQRVDGVDDVQADLTVTSDTTVISFEDVIIDALAAAGITTVRPIVEGSRVTLVGTAIDLETVDLASSVVIGVEGVSQVLNRVVVAADAASAAEQVLHAAGFDSVTVALAGNVAVLTGTVAEEEEALAASDLVLGLPGVDKVDNRVTIGDTSETIPSDAPIGAADALVSAALIDAGFETVSVTFDEGTAFLDGVVPVEVLESGYFAFVDEVRRIAETVGGAERVVNRLRLRGNEQQLRTELKTLLDTTPIVFLSGSSDLTVESETALERAAKIILSQPGLQVFIAGHTDSSGTAESNEQLARARGETVYEYLVSLGVPGNRLKVVSYGELFPGEGTTSADDRRIEFEVGP